MGLWQQMKSGKTPSEREESQAAFSTEAQPGGNLEKATSNGSAGKERFKNSPYQIGRSWMVKFELLAEDSGQPR